MPTTLVLLGLSLGVSPLAWAAGPAAVPPLTPLRVVHGFAPVGRYAGGDRGVDLAGAPGQTVVSATAGIVAFAGPVAGQGVVSVALGDGRRLSYEPLSLLVRTGQPVVPGTPLGRLAGSHLGCRAAACLHWGLRSDTGTYADPMALLAAPRVRLLPPVGGPVDTSAGTGDVGPQTAAAAGSADVGSAVPASAGHQDRSTGGGGTAAVAAITVGAGAAGLTWRRRRGVSRRPVTDLRP